MAFHVGVVQAALEAAVAEVMQHSLECRPCQSLSIHSLDAEEATEQT